MLILFCWEGVTVMLILIGLEIEFDGGPDLLGQDPC